VPSANRFIPASWQVPLGVVLCIPPFNYPVNLAVSKLGPALMAGNTIVLKPPTQGAVSATLMVQCFHKAGIPKGVLNLVSGKGSEIGDYLTTHPGPCVAVPRPLCMSACLSVCPRTLPPGRQAARTLRRPWSV
jgi:delta 1-pyrroline-5-carboxylate dehydrogenase